MRYIISLLLCCFLLCGCTAWKTDKEKIAVYNADGTKAEEYSTVEEVISDSYTDEGNYVLPNIIEGSDVSVEESTTVSVGNKCNNSSTENPSVSVGYIGNKNSKIFHIEDCSAARKIKEGNQVFESHRDEFISKGYTPCKICNP